MRTALFLLLALWPAPVLADVVSPEPTDCPAGSEPVFCHGPPTCRALHCANDAECGAGMRCAALSLCLESHSCGGRLIDPTYDHASRTCAADGTCAMGTCTGGTFCVPGAATDAATGMDAPMGRDAATAPDAPAGIDASAPTDTGSALDAPVASDTRASPDAPGTLVTTYGCGCRAQGGGTSSPGLLAALAIVAATRRRTRSAG